MPARRATSLPLAALLAALAVQGCGPGTPTSPTDGTPSGGSGGGSGGDGSAGGGGAGAGGDGSGGTKPSDGAGGGSATPGIGTAFVVVLGGAGTEWAQDVAAAPGGAVIALTLVGPRDGGAFDQLGLTVVGGGGAKGGRLYDIGAPLAFPRDGALSTGPGGEVYLALHAQCGSSGCKGLGKPLNGSGLVQFAPSGDPRWVAQLAGTVASQPVVDPPGNVAVATSEGGANVVRSFTAAGTPRWQVSLPGGAQGDVFLAADAGANVIAARGGDVTKIDPSGKVAWSRTVGAQLSGVAGTATGTVILAGTTSSGAAILELGPDGSDGAVRALPGPADDVRVEVGGGKRIGAVTGAGGCGATVTALDVGGGGPLWSRPVAKAGCDASQLRVNGVTVTTGGVVVVGGALAGAADLGTGPLSSKGTDALLAGFGP